VIIYEGIAQVNDSILNLVSLSEDDRVAIFTDYVEKLKAEAEAMKEQEEAAKRNATGLVTMDDRNFSSGNMRANPKGQSGDKSFYFYNQTTVSFGKNEFLKIWGERSLKDNWRLSDSKTRTSSVADNDIAAGATDEERFDPQFYISK